MNRHPSKIWKPRSVWKQLVVLFIVVFLALSIVVIADLYSHPGRDWKDTMIIKMIIERREENLEN